MKLLTRIQLLLAAMLFIGSSAAAQNLTPAGASDFFLRRGGLIFTEGKVNVLQQIASNKIDKVEAGGGPADWVSVDGRIFARATWMIEIGEMTKEFSSVELERLLADEMQKKLNSEGFRLNSAKFDLHYVRYQKGSTVGSMEMRSSFLNNGNLPLRYEFIFNESYQPTKK